jgi:soluble cytochrome b562
MPDLFWAVISLEHEILHLKCKYGGLKSAQKKSSNRVRESKIKDTKESIKECEDGMKILLSHADDIGQFPDGHYFKKLMYV